MAKFKFQVYELHQHIPYVNVAVIINDSLVPKFCGSFRLTYPEWAELRGLLSLIKHIEIDETSGVIERTKGLEHAKSSRG